MTLFEMLCVYEEVKFIATGKNIAWLTCIHDLRDYIDSILLTSNTKYTILSPF